MRIGGCTAWGASVYRCFLTALLAAAAPLLAETKPTLPMTDLSVPASAPAVLVRQLGDKSYLTRQRAQRRLQEIGVPAKVALQAALNDSDAEIRFRARQALEHVLNLDFQQKLETFLAASTDCEDDCLPGWQRFRELLGQGHAARRLFVEMQRAERDLLEAAQAQPASAGELLELRCQQIQYEMQSADSSDEQPLSVGSIAALLFVAGKPDVTISTQAASYLNNFSNQPSFHAALSSGTLVEPLRGLLSVWVGRHFDDTMVAYQNFLLAMRYDLKAAIEPAAELAARKEIPAQQRSSAILALGKLGDKRQLPALQSLLDDTSEFTVHGRDGQEVRTQIRDVALAVMVHLSGQNLRDYGFDHFSLHPTWLFNPATLGFKSIEAREQALEKWRKFAKGAGSRE